jgi:putative aldouronate transport system substrate-binding protein
MVFYKLNKGAVEVHKQAMLRTTSAAIMLSLVLSACNSGGASDSKKADELVKGKPTEISLMTVLRDAEVPNDGNPLEKEIETRSNTELKIQWIPSANYNEKLSVTLAGGDLPDVFEILNIETNFKEWGSQGAFASLDELITDKHPNLKKFLAQKYVDELRINKKLYGVPIVQPPGQSAMRVRLDWLEKLKLPEPKTLDDYYKVLKAFTFDDPDGNGKNDTFGLTINGADPTFNTPLLAAFDIRSGKLPFLKDKDGNYVPREITPQMKEGVAFLRKLYDEKILDPEFPGLKTPQVNAKFESSKVGMVVGAINNIDIGLLRLLKIVPTAKIKMIYPPADKEGKQVNHYNTNYQGAYVISSKVPKEKQQKIVDWLEWMVTPEAQDLILWGVDGVQSTGKDAGRKTTDKWNTDGVANYNKQLDLVKPKGNIYPPDNEYRDLIQASTDLGGKMNTDSPLNGVVITSKKWRDAEKELDKVNAGFVKIIAGKESIDTIDKYVQEWLSKGGTEALKELNAEIKEQLK